MRLHDLLGFGFWGFGMRPSNDKLRSLSIASLFIATAFMLAMLPDGTLVLPAGTNVNAMEPEQKLGWVEQADPGLTDLIALDAKVEKVGEGFEWSEGPVWVKAGNYLLFSDVPKNSVYRYQEGQGVDVFLKPSGYTGLIPRGGESGSNGLAIDREGRLVLCQHGDRRVARWEKGCFITLADNYEGRPFNSPNDLVIKSNGDIYFTDPPYGMTPEARRDPNAMPFCGVYRISNDGKVTLLVDNMTRPNGIAFSPDEKTLYVAQSDSERPVWMAFPVKEDGTLGPGRVFFDAKPWVASGLKGGPDGMKVDYKGNLFATGPGGINIIRPDGTFLGRIRTSVNAANCAFGGQDGSVLYITAHMYLLRVQTKTKGLGF